MDFIGRQNHYLPKIENPVEFDWDDLEETFQKIAELPTLDTLLELDSGGHSPTQNWNTTSDLNNLGEIPNGNFHMDNTATPMHQDLLVERKPILVASSNISTTPIAFGYGGNVVKSEVVLGGEITVTAPASSNFPFTSSCSVNNNNNYSEHVDDKGKQIIKSSVCGRKRAVPLQLEDIQKYFDVPITRAAKEMKVGVTVLKKRCRELNIMRWPHRKIKSLKSLIKNVKELGLENEIHSLEEHKRLVEKLPDMELTDRTKKLRQACFKANYKKRKSMAGLA